MNGSIYGAGAADPVTVPLAEEQLARCRQMVAQVRARLEQLRAELKKLTGE